jgi:predicted ATPase
VTLTGPGGAGKTRLALRAAADEIDRFPDGVFFVDLSSATDTDAVVAHVSTALGLSEARDRSPLDDLKRELRPRRLLLVLDNFEQVTASGPTVVDLLADCRSLKVLVTSREALRVRGEHIVSVPPLALPHVSASPPSAVELSQFEAIQLFVERARAVRADFRLTDDNAAAVAEICRRLDGLPLAIELATARLSLFPPDALRERLTSRLKLLRGGARDLPARQQTLRATIEWSYQLLDPGEQRLFELLSVFATAGLESIEAIAADLEPVSHLDAVDGVASLLDKSLIRQAEPTGDDGSPRVTMLETIREFAAERLDAQPSFAGAARDRHARYFAELASRLAAHLADGRSPSGDTINLELENLRIAWRRSVAERDTNRLNQLADALWPVYDGRGWYHATVGLIRDQLAVLETEPPGEERWRRELTLRMNLARALTLLRGYTGEVEDAFAKALALFEGQRERPQLFPVLRALASFHGYRGEDDKAAELAREILELADRQADQSMRVEGEFLLGISLTFGSDLEGGLQLLDHAIASFEAAGYRPRPLRLGNDPRVACLTTSGFALWLRGNPDEAVQRADRAIRLAEELDHPYSLAYALYHCGFLHYWRREPMIVRARADALLRLVGVNDLPIWRALGTCLLGAATSAAGDPETGLRLFRDGLDQYQGLRTPPVFWPFLRFLEADGHVEAQRPAEGMRLIDEALAQAGADQLLSPLFHIVRGDLLMLLDPPDVDGARHAYEVAHEVSRMHGARMLQVRAAVRSTRIAPAADRAGWLATIGALYDSITEGRGTPDLVEARQLVAGG